jgi:hypothetical protein
MRLAGRRQDIEDLLALARECRRRHGAGNRAAQRGIDVLGASAELAALRDADNDHIRSIELRLKLDIHDCPFALLPEGRLKRGPDLP